MPHKQSQPIPATQAKIRQPILPIQEVTGRTLRESLPDLLGSFGFETLAFASAEEFLNSGLMDQVECLILDVTMPGMTGPELQQELMRRKQRIPIVFITAHLDKRAWPALLKSGAVACLVKPFSEKAIVDAVGAALKAE